MRRALIVGIDDYEFSPLSGCINDAYKMVEILSRNQNGSPNFDCKEIVSSEESVTRSYLKEKIEELFSHEADVALFYFSGHGTANNLGGFLVTQDANRYDEGVSMTDILTYANQSKDKIKEVVIILDCCHSGALGNTPAVNNEQTSLREGITILTASRSSQYAMEVGGGGVFTSLVHEALNGGAADVVGNVTVASVYGYADQTLGAWDQRPLFKSHVSKLLPIRNCNPKVPLEILRLLPGYFPTLDYQYPLDKSYEPDVEPFHEENQQIFSHLQKLRSAGLVEPIGEEHMYYAALNEKSCELTPLGRFYWSLVNAGKL
jgi:Caspase domain